MMQVADAMTRDVQVVSPDESIADAARMMADCDCGALPVGENDRLVGMITDRDIVVRGLAKNLSGTARIREVMSADVKYCFEDEDIEDVAGNMGDLQIRRLPVLSRDKRLVGIVSLGDISNTAASLPTAGALSAISEPVSQRAGREHRPH